MSREDARPGAGIGNDRVAGMAPDLDSLALSADERTVLKILVDCGTSRTVAQLAAGCGLSRECVTGVLETLRAQGLITRFNTLVESYAACFPGIEM